VPVSADGTVSITIDTADAKEKHGDEDHRYEIEIAVTDESRRQITGTGSIIAARAPFDVFVALNQGHYQTRGHDPTLSPKPEQRTAKPVSGGAKARLLQVNYDVTGNPVEAEVQSISGSTKDGIFTATFTAARRRSISRCLRSHGRSSHGPRWPPLPRSWPGK